MSSSYHYIAVRHLMMENYLGGSASGFISRDHAKLILLLWLFWISPSELQTKFTGEIALNNVNRYVPVKCTYAKNRFLGNCLCPKIDGKLKTFLCQCHTNERPFGTYFCICMKPTTQTNHINHINCTCKSIVESLTVKCNVISNTRTIKVGILMPFTEMPFSMRDGQYYHSAVFFAFEYINHNKFLLANHSLDLLWGDTECNKNKTVTLTMKMVKEQQVDAIIAAGCESCLATAAIAESNNIPMLSIMCIEKELSDKRKYPTFARTAVTGYELIFTMNGLLSYYKWKKVSVISHDLFPYKKLFGEFSDSYKGEIVSVHMIAGASHYNYSKHNNLTLSYLREISNKSKIIICLVQIDVLKEILIAASQLSMTDGEFVFVGFKSDIDAEPNYPPQLWGKPDFYEEPKIGNGMWQAIDRGYHLCSGLQVLLLLQPDLSIYRNNETKLEYPSYGNPSNVAWSLYDAIVLYANAVSKTINRGEDFRNGRTVLKNIRGETSLGASNYQTLTGGNLDARQPFKLYRYGKNSSSKHDCECGHIPLISKGHLFPSCLSGFSTPKMVPIAYFQAVKTNKTMVNNETEVTVTNIVYRYEPIVGGPTYWPGGKGLKDLEDHYNKRGNESKGSNSSFFRKRTVQEETKKGKKEEKKRKSKSKLAIVIPAVFSVIVLIAIVVVVFRRRWLHRHSYDQKISKKELLEDDGNLEV